MNYLEIAEVLRRSWEKCEREIEEAEGSDGYLKEYRVVAIDVWGRIVNDLVESRCGNDPKWNEERFKFALNTKTCTRVNLSLIHISEPTRPY